MNSTLNRFNNYEAVVWGPMQLLSQCVM